MVAPRTRIIDPRVALLRGRKLWPSDLAFLGRPLCSLRRRHCFAGEGRRCPCGSEPGYRHSHLGGRGLCLDHRSQSWYRTLVSLHVGRRSWLFLIASGLATGLSWICYFRALSMGEASKVAPIDKLSVVFVVLLAWPLLGETITLAKAAGVLLIAAGAIVLAWA